MPWYSKAIGDGVEAYAPTRQIQTAYEAFCLTTATPPDYAVFSDYDLSANVVTVYFSPSARPLAEAFGATACERPTNKPGFGLLCGNQRAWKLLFPSE